MVGVNWINSIHPHYSGNFWWVNTNYMATFNPTINLSNHYNDVEWLIGLNNPKFISLHNVKGCGISRIYELGGFPYNLNRKDYENVFKITDYNNHDIEINNCHNIPEWECYYNRYKKYISVKDINEVMRHRLLNINNNMFKWCYHG